ncbi:hypothetical protein DFJ77DRAFT_2033 [Powellomyces hirtus]|nr:hypothetical protein DFJ77DRAFT_2033 [Powellomyces hirtus]
MAMAKTAPSTPRLTRTSLAAEDAAFTPRTRRSYQALGITPVVIKTWGGGTAVSIAHRTAKEDNTPEPVKAPKATPAIKEPVKAPKTTPATKANKPSVSSSSKPRPATAPTEPAANPTGKARLPAIPPPDNSDELPAGTTVDKSRIGADKGGLKRVVSDKGATPAAPPAKKPRKAQSTSKAVPSKPTQSSSKAKKSAPAHETTTPTAVSNHKN